MAGVGTGGTVMGVARFLKGMDPAIRIHPVEPANSPTLHTGHKVGKHRIQGISDEFIPAIVKLDRTRLHRRGARRRRDPHGPEAGARPGPRRGHLVGRQLPRRPSRRRPPRRDAVVVTVFSDSNKKYLSTDLLRDEPVRDGYLSPDVELLGFRALGRVCAACFDNDQREKTAPIVPVRR